MVIKIVINVENGRVTDGLTRTKCTLEEASTALFRLEQIKEELLHLDFKSDFEVHVGEEL